MPPVSALYSLSTGFITEIIDPPLTDPAQIASLNAHGTGIMDVPLGSNPAIGMIDIAQNKYVNFADIKSVTLGY